MAAIPTVTVKTDRSITIGLLYFKTARHVVLLNNLLVGANLGRMRHLVRRHYSHEADITIIPMSDVREIEFIEDAE